MRFGQSNTSPFSYHIRSLKANTDYLIRIRRTKIGGAEDVGSKDGEVVDFMDTIRTKTVGVFVHSDCTSFLAINY